MIRVAICDDSDSMLDFIREKVDAILTEYGKAHEISVYLSGQDLLNDHASNSFDIVFLDIVMPDINGFEAAKQAKMISKDTYIIFITTESCLVYESFDYHPYYFIPKWNPEYIIEKIRSVIGKLIDEINNNWSICLDLPHNEKKYVDSNSICYIASRSNYIDVVCEEGKFRIRMKLDEMLKKLPQNSFVRIHNRYVLNMRYLGRIDKGRCKAILRDGTELDISRSYKTGFVEKYNTFLRNLPR